MLVTAQQIPEGSYEIRVFADGDVPNLDKITAVMNLTNHGDGVCEMSMAHGKLSHETNTLIGLKAYELGFKKLQFHVLKDSQVTRWAEPAGTDIHFDYYEVDLVKAVNQFINSKAK